MKASFTELKWSQIKWKEMLKVYKCYKYLKWAIIIFFAKLQWSKAVAFSKLKNKNFMIHTASRSGGNVIFENLFMNYLMNTVYRQFFKGKKLVK